MNTEALLSNLKALCEAVLSSGQIKTIQDADNLLRFYNEMVDKLTRQPQ